MCQLKLEGVKKPEFSPRKKHHQAVLQDNRDAVGPQMESWKLPPSLGCHLGTLMDRIVLITTVLKRILVSWVLLNDFNTQVSSLCLG